MQERPGNPERLARFKSHMLEALRRYQLPRRKSPKLPRCGAPTRIDWIQPLSTKCPVQIRQATVYPTVRRWARLGARKVKSDSFAAPVEVARN